MTTGPVSPGSMPLSGKPEPAQPPAPEDLLAERDRRISLLMLENLALRMELRSIRESITWRLLGRFHGGVVERVLPPGTLRRKWYELALAKAGRAMRKGRNAAGDGADPRVMDCSDQELRRQREHRFAYEPLITFLVTESPSVPDEDVLRLAGSLEAQTYARWELRVVTAAEFGSSGETPRPIRTAAAGSGAKGEDGSQGGGEGLSGGCRALVSPKDILSPSALFSVVEALNRHPDARLVYGDYVVRTGDGAFLRTALCPDYCRFYHWSYPYIRGLVVAREELLGGVTGSCGPAGCWFGEDLLLSLLCRVADSEVLHVPEFLCSVAEPSAEPAVPEAGGGLNRSVEIRNYLHSAGVDASVERGLTSESCRVRCALKSEPLVTIVIPTKDNWQMLGRCLRSIDERGGYGKCEVVVVRNNTGDPRALEFLDALKGRHLVLDYAGPFNYSAINNFGAASSRGEVLLFLNDDVEIKEAGSVLAALELAQLEDVGAVGAKLLYPDESVQHAGVIIGLRGSADHWHRFVPAYGQGGAVEPGYLQSLACIREYSAVTGAFLMTRRGVFEEAGGFSEDLCVGFNDIDFCLKVRSGGYRVLFTPYALAYHYESASRGAQKRVDIRLHPDDRKIFQERWYDIIVKGDPFYNPRLDLIDFVPTIRRD